MEEVEEEKRKTKRLLRSKTKEIGELTHEMQQVADSERQLRLKCENIENTAIANLRK